LDILNGDSKQFNCDNSFDNNPSPSLDESAYPQWLHVWGPSEQLVEPTKPETKHATTRKPLEHLAKQKPSHSELGRQNAKTTRRDDAS